MRRPATLACLLVASILLTGCAGNSSGRNMPPIGSGPASGGTDSADETGGIDGVYCDADFAYARVNLAAERGTIFDWADDPAVYAYAPLQTDVGDPWCAFVSYGEGWVDGVYLEADWDEFLAKLDRGGLTVAMIDGVSAEISGNPNGMSGWDGYGYVYYRDFAEDLDRPFIQVLWYPSDPPRE